MRKLKPNPSLKTFKTSFILQYVPLFFNYRWEDENLSQTGLSDTAEILDELVREGYLSPTDWSLSASQTAHHSRYTAD